MTIGIAARGPRAGRAILSALRLVETVGKGAIGGFVSLAVIADGRLLRAEGPDGGGAALFDGSPPSWIDDAGVAVLMSSGPNRPAPLAQFTPGDPEAGLVTGHRFPNAPGQNGKPLNLDVLERMRSGDNPEAAISYVIQANGDADAGLIAVSVDGQIYAADTARLARFSDRGQARLASGGAEVAVLHNAILPHRGLALLAAETALAEMDPPPPPRLTVRLEAGVPLVAGLIDAVHVDERDQAVAISVSDARLLSGRWSFGLGYRASVLRGGISVAALLYEPYMLAENGRLYSIDGQDRAQLFAG